MQIKLNTKRAYQRVWNDLSSTMSMVIGNIIMALITCSVFFGTSDITAGFAAKGGILFFAVLLNAATAMSEINNLYAQRPIVEKQASYAFYHPSTEAIAGVVSDIPVKFDVAVAFNVIMYFMANLRREPSQFFIYFLYLIYHHVRDERRLNNGRPHENGIASHGTSRYIDPCPHRLHRLRPPQTINARR
ncbi:ABC-2 type transporter-domain-containing protein [Aspergillus keveii]|uniref:ABC-2 type transporter-domain-containing protein n=1 Tax=Aspergillus keveii TaxID=714993 RepID=A0ABR4FJD6_9EURO